MMAFSPARMRQQLRRQLDDQHERTLANNIRIFREALIRRGSEPQEIEALVRELEERLRGNHDQGR